MGLKVHRLKLQDWRSFKEKEFIFSPGVTVLVGPNAVGKTNTIEALQLLTAGYSFRKPTPAQLIKQDTDSAQITAELTGDGRLIDVVCQVKGNRRSFFTNNKTCKAGDMPRSLMSILFNPDDLSLVKGSARLRRDELDDFGKQAAVGYANLLSAYQRTVEQRNRLLKDTYPNFSLLEAWDASLALGGASLLYARLRMFQRLCKKMIPIYQKISDGEELSCHYISSLSQNDDNDVKVEELTKNELVDKLTRALQQSREDDLRRQQTLIGPHRDDVLFEISGRSARNFGSQGQQRSVVLAWKMAEVEVAKEIVGSTPLLLLDDVMSELDETRRLAVVNFVKKDIQTVVTTTNLGYFSDELLEQAEVIHFEPQL